MLGTQELRDELAQRMTQLMQEAFTRVYFADLIDANWSVIAGSVETQPGSLAFDRHPQNHHSAQGVPELHMETMLEFLGLRYTFLDLWPEPKLGRPEWGGSRSPLDPPPSFTDRVTRHVWGARVGGSLFFTDVNGWAIARIDFLGVPEGLGGVSRLKGEVEVSVREDPAQPGIDRIWSLRKKGHGAFDALLTLYYRHELPGIFSGENWFSGGDMPVGQQWELAMAERPGSSVEILPDSRVNPFSKKVEGVVRGDPELAREFVITLR